MAALALRGAIRAKDRTLASGEGYTFVFFLRALDVCVLSRKTKRKQSESYTRPKTKDEERDYARTRCERSDKSLDASKRYISRTRASKTQRGRCENAFSGF